MEAWLAAAAAVCAGLAYALWRARAESARLRARLEGAAMDLQRLQLAFSRFAPDEVVERIAAGGVTDAEKREVTVLFADLVSFTALAESVDPAVLVRILNGYFERMSRAITDHRGHLSTLIGDGILALFGALEPNPWQSNDALHAALAMQEEITDYNTELAAESLPQLALGVGLHRGVGVAGLVGSRELMQFTVVGRTINVAARIQDLTRVHDTPILVTREVRDALDSRFTLHSLGATPVRGIEAPVEIFAAESFEARHL